MGLSRPNGKYADQMTGSDGWLDVDEHEFLNRASLLTDRLRKLTVVLETWHHEQADISSGTLWSGSGASAGTKAINSSIDSIESQQTALVTLSCG